MTLVSHHKDTQGSVTNAVQVPPLLTFGRALASGTVYSGAKFDADGSIYARAATGAWQLVATWLVAGSAATYYLSRTIDSGTLTTDAGAGPLQMNTDREYDIQKSSGLGVRTAMVSFSISNDVSGTPVVASGTYSFEVERGLV